jgi:hypothetical protein
MGEHEAPTGQDLGKVISSTVVRRVVYGTYVVLLLLAGALSAGLLSTGTALPPWLVGVTAALTFLGAPVGTLALANTKEIKS